MKHAKSKQIKETELFAPITEIQRFSIHDGPGIRTLVFFKGCPLQCKWCQNPETMSSKKELMYFRNMCIQCFECIDICPKKAISKTKKGIKIYREKCDLCGLCVENCYSEALKFAGKSMSVSKVFEEAIKDKTFYENTRGGITLSGGECTLYPEFSRELLRRFKWEGIHTAIETSGFCSWLVLKTILEFIDLVLYDIKHLDPVKHKFFTGKSNKIVLENLEHIVNSKKLIIIRVPLIPGYNDDENNLKTIAQIAKWANAEVQVLPFHQFGKPKWRALDFDYECSSFKSPSRSSLKKVSRLMRKEGVYFNIVGSGN